MLVSTWARVADDVELGRAHVAEVQVAQLAGIVGDLGPLDARELRRQDVGLDVGDDAVELGQHRLVARDDRVVDDQQSGALRIGVDLRPLALAQDELGPAEEAAVGAGLHDRHRVAVRPFGVLRLLERGVRVAAHDDVDAGHVLRDEVVVAQLGLIGVDAAVRDHDDDVDLVAQLFDHRLDIGIDERHDRRPGRPRRPDPRRRSGPAP